MQQCIGLISDTHGSLDERALSVFRDAKVAHILHAGDIGPLSLLAKLEAIAPVTAVLGNNDSNLHGAGIEREALVNINGVRIFLVHRFEEAQFDSSKDIIVFGHTHRPVKARDPLSKVLVVNPGSASRPRMSGGPSVALLDLSDAQNTSAQIIYLDQYEAALNCGGKK